MTTTTAVSTEEDLGTGREATATIGVAGWTLVSRISGLARVAVAGATLGPTYFANIFQATNTVPNITYNLMAGSLLTTLIVPSFVAALDEHGIERARQLARNLTGVILAGFFAAALLVLAAGPVIVHLLTLGVPGSDAGQATQQAWVLLLLVLPQIVLYGIIAVAIAAQNARGHFALAAAAPAVENIVLILTLLVAAKMFGIGLAVGDIPPGFLAVLGIGATLAVVAHASLQCFGAARAGLPLWPRWGWHDPAVRVLCRRTVPTIGTASLDAAWYFALIVASGTVPGGVVAFQIGLNFYNLPLALSAKAVGTVLLPHLSRDSVRHEWAKFRETYERGLAWSWFIAVPASIALVVLARPIGTALAFGAMQRDHGPQLLSASVAVLGLALIAASINAFARQACYARHDVRTPLVAGAVLVAITLVGAPFAVRRFGGAAALAALGVVVVVGELVRSLIVDRAARTGTPKHPGWAWRTLVRDAGVGMAVIVPAALVARFVGTALGGHVGAIAQLAVCTALGLAGYLALQAFLRAPELPERFQRAPRRTEVGVADAVAGLPDARHALPDLGQPREPLDHGGVKGVVGVALSRRHRDERTIAAGIALLIVGSAVAAIAGPKIVLLGVIAVAMGVLFVSVAQRPVLAAYIFLGALPIIGGIDRGSLIPLLRPGEALQGFLTAAVVAGAVVRMFRGERMYVRFTRLDRTIVVLAVLASLWPLCWQLARAQVPTSTDVQSTVVLWRLAALYALFRWVVRTEAEVRRCLWIAVGGACLLSVLAIFQSLGFLHIGGPWTPTTSGDAVGRGGATLTSSIAVGDYLAYTFTIVLMWMFRNVEPRRWMRAIACLLVLGSLGTGQFSAWIALGIVVIVVAQHEGQLRRVATWFAPMLLVAGVVAWPVVSTRLSGFGGGGSIPSSWLGRIDNLTNFYLPQLAGFHWVLGVRPNSVLPAPETWRDAIFLESGVLWFFWVGGIPLFVAFCFFARRAFINTGVVARARNDDVGVAAVAARAALCSMLVLSLIDMHLTLRGGGDLFFILLGLAANANVPIAQPRPDLRMEGSIP